MIHALLNADFSHALETLLAVSVLILVVLMIRRPVARQFGAGVVYLLWAIPAVRFFLPPLATPLSMLNLDFAPAGQAAAEAIAPMGTEIPVTLAAPVVAAWTPVMVAEPVVQESSLSLAAQVLPALLIAGVALWIGGALFVAARNLIAHWRLMQTVDREAMPVSAPMADLVARIAVETGLRRPPRVVASLISRGPFVTGLFRPVVVMPAWFEDDYTPTEARAALTHELMHVRRGDLWALQGSELLVAAMWFNPLAYIARNAFRTDQEAACDADVLARCQTNPHAYGSTLVKAARLHLPEPELAAGRLPLTHALKERLTRMTYPAPSSRRRMIGFGAAVLFGASTLAITASVAAAGEPNDTETQELRIETDGLLITDAGSDRQIVMLGDPMAKVMPMPPEPPEVAELQRQIQADVAELTGAAVMGPVMDWQDSAEWQELTALAEELTMLHTDTATETVEEVDGKRIVKRVVMRGNDMTPEQREATEAKLEAKAAALEAKMAARDAKMEAHEQVMDSQISLLETRIEAKSAEIERIMEKRFGPQFEARIEAQAALIERLVEECEGAELKAGETRIMERKDTDGETFRLACVKGGRDQLKAATTRAAVDSHPGITAAEKAAFNAAAAGERRKSVIVLRSDFVQPPEPPEAPEAPEAQEPLELPELPELPMAPEPPPPGE